MAKSKWPNRNIAARSFHQLRRFCHLINVDKVFGTHSGRFTQSYTWRELYELYRLTCQPVNIEPRYNIAPTTMIDAVVPHEAGCDLRVMRWGLIPSWWKKTAKEAPSTFNARAETVATKPMFRAAFK